MRSTQDTPTKAVLFDLGNTLAEYFGRAEQHTVLEEANREVQACLQDLGLLTVTWDTIWRRVLGENKEGTDHRVGPLIERLARIFAIDSASLSDEVVDELCDCWLRPVFARGRCYEDSLPVLQELRAKGSRTAIVSNTPWGSPARAWRGEIERLGLDGQTDAVVFCTDCGWRKPASQIFEYTTDKLGVLPDECVFVGDEPRWDLAGPRRVGMRAVLIDREGKLQDSDEKSIRCLSELWERM